MARDPMRYSNAIDKSSIKLQGRPEARSVVWALIFNGLILIMEGLGFWMTYINEGMHMFIYYTVDSNLFAFLASLIFVFEGVRALIAGDNSISKFVKLLRYMSTCCLMVTFLVVVAFLAPFAMGGTVAEGYRFLLLQGSGLYHHLLCPLFAMFSLFMFEERPLLKKAAPGIALVPTLVYGFTAIVMNLERIWDGPYPFLRVYDQSIAASCLWAVAIFGGAYLVAWIIWKLDRVGQSV